MAFLSKEQQDKLKEKGWDLIDNKDGAFWVGWDWETKQHPLTTINKTIDLEDGAEGYDFLIVAKQRIDRSEVE